MVHDKHSPVKKKVVRGNKASFMTNELSKAIMNRFKIKKKIQNGRLVKTWQIRKKENL